MTNHPVGAAPLLRLELFEPAVDEVFTISFTDARFDLRLREVTALKHHVPQIHSRPPFSLLFVCPDRRILNQGSYAIEHERLGMLEIFLVPVGADENGVQYEAVFS
jgi:hypothetical protein